jgi:hypothetical protein
MSIEKCQLPRVAGNVGANNLNFLIMKNFNLNIKISRIVFISILLFGFITCSKDINTSNQQGEESLNSRHVSLLYRSNVFKMAVFDQPVDQLTEIDKILTSPTVEHYKYEVNQSANTIKISSMKSADGVEQNFSWNNAVVDWEMNNNGDDFTVQSGGEILESFDLSFDQNTNKALMFEKPLVPASEFQLVTQFLIQHMSASQFNQNTLKLINTAPTGDITEIFLDTESQSITLIKEKDQNGNVKSQRSFFFKVENGIATLKSEIFESFERSINSDLPFKSVSITEYFKL